MLAVEDFLPTENGVGNGVGTIWTLADHQGTLQVLVQAKPNGTHEADNLRADPLNTLPTYAGQWTAGGSHELHWSVHTRYTGREYDFDTGLYFNRARVLNPYVQRFMSQDSYGFAAGDPNLYRYAFNSPANATDPSGHVLFLAPWVLWTVGGLAVANIGAWYSWRESSKSAAIEQHGVTNANWNEYQGYATRSRYGLAVAEIGYSVAKTAPTMAIGGWALGALSGLGRAGAAFTGVISVGALGVAGMEGYGLLLRTPQMDGPQALEAWGKYGAGWGVGLSVGIPAFKSGRAASPAIQRWLATRVVEAGVWISPDRIPEVGPFEPIYGRLNPGEKLGGIAPKRGLLDDAARFAQRDYSEVFSAKGIKAYSELAGKRIITIDDLADAIRKGSIDPSKCSVDVIRRGESTLILNTRTSEALRRAGIPRSRWNAVDRSGDSLFEELLNRQLIRNHLDNAGVPDPISQGLGL